jgi:hypothetical protein
VDEKTESFRLFNCALCYAQVRLCTRCDRGNRYCGQICAVEARRRSRADACRRYQRSFAGALNHANRQAAYRVRVSKQVTHQGSAEDQAYAILSEENDKEIFEATPTAPESRERTSCTGCGAWGGLFARPDFIGRCRLVRRKGERHGRIKGNRIRDSETISR